MGISTCGLVAPGHVGSCFQPRLSGGEVLKDLLANAGDMSSIPGSGRSLGVGNGNLLQYSCLENYMDRGGWLAIVPGVTKSRT